jgi:hypothetical protein
MADPQITECLADAAIHLGDPNQEQFNNSILTPFFGQSFREVYDVMLRWKLQLAKKTAYFHLPANTNQFLPSQAGINDLGEPNFLWERLIGVSTSVSNATNATPVVLTVASAGGINTGNLVDVTGIVGPTGVNSSWYVTVSGNTLSLNGSVAGGAYVSGGEVIYSQNTWEEMRPADYLPQTVPAGFNGVWSWQNGRFFFPGATNAVEIKIEYSASGAAPSSGTVGIDNSRNFIAFRTAGLAAAAYDMPSKSLWLNAQALGPSGQPDGTGGALRGLVLPMLLEKQKRKRPPLPFRPRRNDLTRLWW